MFEELPYEGVDEGEDAEDGWDEECDSCGGGRNSSELAGIIEGMAILMSCNGFGVVSGAW